MIIGRNNEVVELTGFLCKKLCGLSFGPQKGGRDKGMVVSKGWSHGGLPLHDKEFASSLALKERLK